MANIEQQEILSEDGVHRWNQWRVEHPTAKIDLY